MHSHSRWHEADRLFQLALERPERDRRAFVESECADDPGLATLVLELLDADDAASSFLADSVEEYCALPWQKVFGDPTGNPEEGDGSDGRIGARLGAYRLERRIGRGGMASVYLAQRADGQFDQQVAIKLLRRGLDTDDIVRRFVAERQILSTLSHPNIARVFDGGATRDGLPYLVMEYVDGTPILEWCDEARLPVADRLRLFCQVGRAVQHAHRSLVVHRDLKPSNILVDPHGEVKLLDFGIAKLLAEDAPGEATRTGMRAMTPAYASPELVRGDPITTASDVYQLGLLLCQLLCGRLPYEVNALSPARAERQILEASPTRPSALADQEAAAARSATERELVRSLAGDLDQIVLQALRSDPHDRYASADAFVDDIERHLDGEPVRARPDALAYRARKFIGRNRVAVAAASIVFVVVLASAVVATWQAGRLAVERDRAVSEEARAEAVTAFLTEMFEITNPNEGAADSAGAVALLERGVERAVRELGPNPQVEADVLSAIGNMYLARGLVDDAQPVLERTVSLRRAAAGDAEALVEDLLRLANSYRFEDQPKTLALLDEAIEIAERDLGPRHRMLGMALMEFAEVAQVGPGVREAVERSLSILRDQEGDVREELASILHLSALGGGLDRMERLEEALEIRRELFGDDHTAVAATLNDMALKLEPFDPLAADTLLERAATINERIHGPNHHQTISIINNLAGRYRDRGDCAKAEPLYREMLRRREEAYPDNLGGIIYSKHGLGWCWSELGRAGEAEAMLREVVDFTDGGPEIVHQVARSTLGRSLALQGKVDEAEPLLLESYEWLTANDPHPVFMPVLLDRVIDLYDRTGRPGLADEYRLRKSQFEASLKESASAS